MLEYEEIHRFSHPFPKWKGVDWLLDGEAQRNQGGVKPRAKPNESTGGNETPGKASRFSRLRKEWLAGGKNKSPQALSAEQRAEFLAELKRVIHKELTTHALIPPTQLSNFSLLPIVDSRRGRLSFIVRPAKLPPIERRFSYAYGDIIELNAPWHLRVEVDDARGELVVKWPKPARTAKRRG